MKSSLSFDRAAGYYDRTREFPEAFATKGIEAILETAGQGAKILDVGTGTGRVSVPLLKRGADLIGCDLSLNMMEVLRRKEPSARLTRADAALLPFPSRSFDAITTCHVMHLVGPWREALREYSRLLKPAGVYINAWTDYREDQNIGKRIRDFWESRVAARGASSKRPGIENPEELHAELRKIGASLEPIEVAHSKRTYSVRETIQDIDDRIDSHTWVIPDEVFAEVLLELHEWAAHEFEDLDKTFTEESIFVLDVARFPHHG